MKRLMFVFGVLFFSHITASQNLANLFDGSLSYSVPVVPGVALHYSSSQVPTIVSDENRDVQASWVGAGWSLEFESIKADLKGTTATDDDEFYYVSSAGTARIVKDNSGVFRLENNPYWKIEFTTSGDYITGITITKSDGSKSKFGDFQTGIGPKQANRCLYAWGGRVTDFSSDSNATQVCYEWDLSQTIDPYGVILFNYYYNQEQVALPVGSSGSNLSYTRASYIDHIADSLSGQTIRFIRAARDTNEYQNVATSDYKLSYYESKYLDSIKVFPTPASIQPIKSFDLSYQLIGSGTKKKRLLTSVIALDGSSHALPSFSFSYDSTKYYVLSSVQTPSGGTTQITTQTATPSYTNNFSLSVGSKGQVVSAATVVAGYDNHNSQLQIRKWVGEWKSKTVTLTDAIADTVGFLKATDDHVLLVYRTKGQNNKILVYDWRDDTQDWQMDICDSASNIYTPHKKLFADISPTGSYVAAIVGDTNVIGKLQVWRWDTLLKSWDVVGYPTISGFPKTTFYINENMAVYDSSGVLGLVQWKKSSSGYVFYGPISIATSLGSTEQIALQSGYIGRWNNSNLYMYNLKYDNTTGFYKVTTSSTQQFGSFSSSSKVQFADERVIVLDNTYLRIWKKEGAGNFTALTAVSVSLQTGSSWDNRVAINNDWTFVYNYRIGSVSGTPPYETKIFGYSWNRATGVYDDAGSIQQHYCSIMPYRSQYSPNMILSDDYISAIMVVVIGTGQDYGEPTIGAFKLDRTNPSSWNSNERETYAMAGITGDSTQVIVGGRLIGSFDKNGDCLTNFFHDIDKNFGSSITVYRASQVTQNSNMGTSTSVVTRNYSFDAAPTFDPSLTYAGYGWVKDSLATGQGGSTTTSFSNVLSQPRLRGAMTRVERYKQGGVTLVDREIPTFATHQDPNKWYLYQVRKTADTSYVDGITKAAYYAYNDTNGEISKVTNIVGVQSDIGGVRDKVTNLTYAFSQYSSMKTANMLSQIYEKADSAVGQMSQISAFANGGGAIDSAKFTISTMGDQTVTYSYVNDNGYDYVGTAPGRPDIARCDGSSGSGSFIGQRGRTYYLTAYAGTGMASAQITANYDGGILISKKRTEYDGNYRPLRSLTYDGANWITTDSIVSRDSYGHITQSDNIDKVRTTTLYGYNSTLPVATAVNATPSQVFVDDFEDGDLAGWTITDNYTQGNTTWANENGSMKQTDYGSAVSEENDHILHDNGSEITGSTVFEFDLKIADSDSWDLTIAMGGGQWDGVHGASLNSPHTEEAVWTAINNETWYYLDTGGWKTIKSGLTVGKKYHFKIVANAATSTADYYVDGVRMISAGGFRTSTTGFQKIEFGNYGYATVNTIWYIDNVRMYSAGALVTSTGYNPSTRQVTSTTDVNGTSTYYQYDGFGRIISTTNTDDAVLSQRYYYYSRDGHGGTFTSSDPDYSETITYPQGFSKSGLAGYWRLEGSVTDEMTGTISTTIGLTSTKGSMGGALTFSGSTSSYSYAPLDAAYQVAQPTIEAWVNFSSTASVTMVCASVSGAWADGRGYYLCTSASGNLTLVLGNASGAWKAVNGSTVLQTGKWYHVAGTYDGTYLRVYVNGQLDGSVNIGGITISYTPRSGCGPNPSTLYLGIMHNSNNSSPSYAPDLAYALNGTMDEVKIYNRALSGSEILSHYNASVNTLYSDGLGRTIQSHTHDGFNDLVAAVEYDSLGRAFRNWRPYSCNTSYKYDASYSSHAISIFGISNPYTETVFKPDPLSRDSVDKQVGYSVSDEAILHDYGSATLSDGIVYQYAQVKQKQSNSGSTPWIDSRQYADRLGRVVQSSVYAETGGGDTLTTKTTYNFLSEPVIQIAPKGDSTIYTYNFLGQLTQKKNPDEGTSKYIYDKAGRLRFMIDSLGLASSPNKVLYWKYDSFGRVLEKGYITSISWGDGSTLQNYANTSPSYPTTPLTWRKKYTYDAGSTGSGNLVGKLSSVLTNNDDDSVAEVEEYFTYDKFGNVTSVSQKVIDYNSSTSYITNYQYDLLRRATEIDYPASSYSAVNVTYQYDQVGRVTQVGQVSGNPFANYAYDTKGQMATETLNPVGAPTQPRTFGYDVHGWLTSISSNLFTEKIAYSSGGYNSNEGFYHGIIATDTSSYPIEGYSTLGYKFQYDNFGRLITADNTLAAMDVGVGAATSYDKNSNIKTIKRGTGSNLTYTYYTGNNQVQNTGSGNYTYDVTGNLTVSAPTQFQFTYDPFTELTMSAVSTVIYQNTYFEYGGAKQRVLKSTTTETSSTSTLYLHGGSDYPLMEKVSDGTERTYVYGPTGLIAMRVNSTWYYIHKDHLGSVRVASSSGTTANAAYDYDAYGTVGRATQNVSSPYRFTGQEFDLETSMHNFRARMYDSNLGMFYAADPAHQTHSRYGYAGGNPVSFVDPTGMMTAMAPGQPSMDDILRHLWESDMGLLGGGGGGTFDASYAGPNGTDAFGNYPNTPVGALPDGNGGYIIGQVDVFSSPQVVGHDENNNPIYAMGTTVFRGNGGYWQTIYYGTGTDGAYTTNSKGEIVQIAPPTMEWQTETVWVPGNGRSYYQNALNYKDVPYAYGKIDPYGVGIDCSALVCLATGNRDHVWTTKSGTQPPGDWINISPPTTSPDDFLNFVQEGDLFVWSNDHTAFYAGDGSLFHAHGREGNPTGYTHDAVWWLNNHGYPIVYRQGGR